MVKLRVLFYTSIIGRYRVAIEIMKRNIKKILIYLFRKETLNYINIFL